MNNKRIATTFLVCIVLTLASYAALSRPVIELTSRYNGDGWFEYRLRTLEDPFFEECYPFFVEPVHFTNRVASIPPVHWSDSFYRGWLGMGFDFSNTPPRINETIFYVRSSCTNFRRAPQDFVVNANVVFTDCYCDGLSITAVPTLDCLVPCAPEVADGSSPELVAQIELVPDIKIDALVITNGAVYGLTFSWSQPSTVELQGSHNMTNWETIARFFGDAPQTTWTSNTPLNSFGEYFRLSLVANRHLSSAKLTTSLHSTPR
jgi:hypothetical protein